MLRRWESEHENLILSKELIKVELFVRAKGSRSQRKLSKSFTVVIRLLSTLLIKPNFIGLLYYNCITVMSAHGLSRKTRGQELQPRSALVFLKFN